MKHLLFLFFFFLLIGCDTFVKSLKVVDLTTKSSLKQYSDGPDLFCNFTFVFSLESLSNQTFINTPSFSQIIYSRALSPSNNNNSAIFQIQTKPYANDGLIVANFSFGESLLNGSIISSYININFYCSDPPIPVNNIIATDFNVYNSEYMVSYFSISSWNRANIISLSLIENLKTQFCDSNCRIEKKKNLYIIYMKLFQFETITFSINSTYHKNFNFTLTINGVTKNIKKINMVDLKSISFYPLGSNINSYSVTSYSYSLINLNSDEPIKYLWSSFVNSSGETTKIQLSQLVFSNRLSQAFINQNLLLNNGTYQYIYWNNKTTNINQVGSNENVLSPIYIIDSYISGDNITSGELNINQTHNETIGFNGYTTINTFTLSFPLIFKFNPPMLSFNKYYSFPFGCGMTNQSTSTIEFTQSFGKKIKSDLSVFIGSTNIVSVSLDNGLKNRSECFINSLEFIYIGFNKFLVKSQIDGIFYYLDSQNINLNSNGVVIRATGYNEDGFYSEIFTPWIGQFKDFTIFKGFSIDLIESPLSIFLKPRVPNLIEVIESPTINSIKFEIQSMNSTNVGGINTIYLTFKNYDDSFSIFYHPSFILSPRSLSSNIHFHKSIPFTWDENKNLFKADFYVPANIPTGEVEFSIVDNIGNEYSSNYIKLFLSTIIPTKDDISLTTYSEYGYSIPPIIKSYSFEKDTVEIYDLQNLNSIYFKIQLQPTRNEFDNGFISIASVGSNYKKMYFNFTFTNEQLVSGTNDTFKFELTLPCFSSKYEILNVTLIDKQGYFSSFNKYSYNGDVSTTIPLTIDPFMIFNSINGFEVICLTQPTQDSTPIITSFLSNYNSITINSPTRNDIQFFLEVMDPNGIMTTSQLPFIYLSGGLVDDSIAIPLEPVRSNFTHATFKSNLFTIPIGFGLPFNSIPLSVYGICNKIGNIGGFNSLHLNEMDNSSTKIISEILVVKTNITGIPIITGASTFYSFGGDLTLFGKNLQDVTNVKVSIQSNVSIHQVIGYQNEGSLKINLNPINESFYVFIDVTGSNSLIINPIQMNKVNQYIIIPSTPFPTNPSQQCIGNPQCGGSSRGICTPSGCVCYSPWVGESCNSKVLVVSPPVFNPETPSTNFTYYDDNYGSEIAGIISFIELREIDIQSKPIKHYLFDKWMITKINENENLYTTSILENSKLICNVSVSTIWYKELTVITFADQKVSMDPSTLKYNINITTYPFSNKLNNLQLVMSAVAKETYYNSSDYYCSSNVYGDTVSDNSNYLKLTINYQSIYGRFIKRGIIDFKTISIGNSQLASNELTIENDNKISSTFQKSYIGINIPYYQLLAQLDPSFSVIVNPNFNDNNENSICNQSRDGINVKVVIGIVVGVVGFAIVLTVVILFIIKKKHHLRQLQFKIKLKKQKI